MSDTCGIIVLHNKLGNTLEKIRQEIYVTTNASEAVDNEALKVLIEELKSVSEGNVTLSQEHNHMGFQLAYGHIEFDGVWGLVQSDVDDLLEVSRNHPEYEFSLVRYMDRTVASTIETLEGRYFKCDISGGRITAEYKPAPVRWVLAEASFGY